MPVPHEVTREFFIPTEDNPFLENQAAAQPIEERIGDLLFLFNLLDAAFGRTVPDDATEQNDNNESDANNEENEEGEMFGEETEHMTEDVREIPANTTPENHQLPPQDGEEQNEEQDETQEEGGNAHLTRHVIRLDEFDLLALPLLLMRSRIRRNEEPARQEQERSQPPSENMQDPSVDPLLRIFSRAFGPHP